MAQDCLEFIHDSMDKDLISIHSIAGEKLYNMAIREQWDNDIKSADDAILKVCLSSKNACIITHDINLRLKARTAGVFVLKIGELKYLCM